MFQIVTWLWLLCISYSPPVSGEPCQSWIRNRTEATNQVDLVVSSKCVMKATINNPFPNLNGDFIFSQDNNNNYNDDEGITKINVRYTLNQLTNGGHKYHVHRYGDIFASNGDSTGSHFVGVTNDRPLSGPQEVGLLNGGLPIQSDGRESTGSYSDNVASMNDYNSILGRGMIVHGTEDPNPDIRAGQCVIGLTATNANIRMPDSKCIHKATCTLTPVQTGIASGLVEITTVGSGKTKKLFFKGLVYGLGDGDYQMRVHKYGDISNNGLHTGGIFGGTQFLRQTGNLGGDTFTFQSVKSWASVSFEDTVASLNGPDSIMGRSLTIEDTNGVISALCIVGLGRDVDSPQPKSPSGISSSWTHHVTATAAVLYGRSLDTFPNFHAYVSLFLLDEDHWLGGGSGARVRYLINGLVPGDFYIMAVNRYSAGLGGVFVGWNATREKVGAWKHPIQVDANGQALGEFIDHYTKFNDYNSILGRSIVLYAGNDTNGTVIGQGTIGRMEEGTTRDYPAAPITKANVYFSGVNRLTTTHGVLDINSNGSVSYNLMNLVANHSYIIYLYTTGDLFSIDDSVKTVTSAGNMQDVLGQELNTDGNGQTAGTFSTNFMINGQTSILGKVVTVVDFVTKNTVAAGVLGIKEDDPAYSGPTEIRSDSPTPSPTQTVIIPPGTQSPIMGLGMMSTLSSWCVLSFVTYIVLVSLL